MILYIFTKIGFMTFILSASLYNIIISIFISLNNAFLFLFNAVAINDSVETMSNGQSTDSLPQSYDSNSSQSQTPVPPPRKVSIPYFKIRI